jgi:hypothetical protein
VYSVGKDLKDARASGTPRDEPSLPNRTAASAEDADWPEYPGSKRLLSRTRYEDGDLVYHIHAKPE